MEPGLPRGSPRRQVPGIPASARGSASGPCSCGTASPGAGNGGSVAPEHTGEGNERQPEMREPQTHPRTPPGRSPPARGKEDPGPTIGGMQTLAGDDRPAISLGPGSRSLVVGGWPMGSTPPRLPIRNRLACKEATCRLGGPLSTTPWTCPLLLPVGVLQPPCQFEGLFPLRGSSPGRS
jgi:hypothetical protein